MNSINLEVVNGHWKINEKLSKNCSIAKKNFLAQFIKMRLVKTKISQRSSFKNRANEIKAQYNYKFADLRIENKKEVQSIGTLDFIKSINPNLFERKNK